MLTSASYAYQLTTEPTISIQLKKDTLRTKAESKEQFLLQSITQGNRHAFWQLWLLYEKYLYHRCKIWMGGNDIDAEEALSQSRLKAWEKLPNYASKITNPKAWLTRITHNLCMDLHRKRQRHAQNTDRIEEIAVTDLDIVASNSDSPESVMLNHELKIYIRHAINSLPPKLRDPWNLLYYYQMSYGEIAQRLMLSKNNVYKRIQQGRIILQKQLNKYFLGVNSSLDKKLRTDKTSNKSSNSQIYISPSAKVLNVTLSPKSSPTQENCQLDKVQVSQLFNQRDSLEKAEISSETQSNFVAKTFPGESSEFTDISAPIITETSIEIINYQVTALCLETFSLAV